MNQELANKRTIDSLQVKLNDMKNLIDQLKREIADNENEIMTEKSSC